MKCFLTIIVTVFFSSFALASENSNNLDLNFKSIIYQNKSIPVLSLYFSSSLSIDVSSDKFNEIIAFADSYFPINQDLHNEEKYNHIYLGLNYRF